MRRATQRALVTGVILTLGAGLYLSLDALDLAPGWVTLAPLPTPTSAPSPSRSLPSLTIAPPAGGMPVRPAGLDAPLPSPAGLAAALAPVLAQPELAGTTATVRDALTGAVLFDQSPQLPQIPASTTKLVAALAVAKAFPPGSTLTTTVRLGPDQGRLVLVAGGDSLLAPGAGDPTAVAGRAGLGDLADQTVAALRARTVGTSGASGGTAGGPLGPVVVQVDAGYAPGPRFAATWPNRFRDLGLTGPVSMLGLATGRAEPGKPAPDPIAATAAAFVQRLLERGVVASFDPTPAASAGPTGPSAPASGPMSLTASAPASGPASLDTDVVLAQVHSAPVGDILGLALQESDNALTEILARQAAYRAGHGSDFAAVGAHLRAELAATGIDPTGVALVDASGLSMDNRIPARVLTDVLRVAVADTVPGLANSMGWLPVAGLSGTLDDRFTAPAATAGLGWVRAKTGSLAGVNSLAGYVMTAQGRLLVFAVMQQGDPGTTPVRPALDRFGATLATCGCR